MRLATPILLALLSSACPSRSTPPPPYTPYGQPGYYPQGGGYNQRPPAQAASPLSGTFANKGGSLTLQESYGQVRGTLVGGGLTGNVQGTVANGLLTGTIAMSDRTSGAFSATVRGNELALTMQGRQTLRFTRTSPPPGVAQGKQPPPTGIGAGVGSTVKTVVPSATAAAGDEYRDDVDGWSVRTPEAWKFTAKGMTLTFASNSEAGTIFVKYSRGWSLAQMEQGATKYMQQLGAKQLGQTSSFKAKAGKAIVLELAGSTAQGALHGRAIGIVGTRGALTIVGLTTPERIETLRQRVDQIALSAKFPEPKPPPEFLVGPWWRYAKGSERTLELCADGSFLDNTATEANAATGAQFGQGSGAGRWTAQGDNLQGRLRLVFNSGTVEEHDYKFKTAGGDIKFDGKVYGRNPDVGGKCK
jgi:hypothetical protein